MTRPSSVDHARHDLDLVAAATDRGAAAELVAAADAQASTCDTCFAIYQDLRALAVGLTELPPALAAPRDMRLTPADAARLQRGDGWRGFLRRFAPGTTPVLVPFASALTTLGVAGILLTTVFAGGVGLSLIPSSGSAGAAPETRYAAPVSGSAAPAAAPNMDARATSGAFGPIASDSALAPLASAFAPTAAVTNAGPSSSKTSEVFGSSEPPRSQAEPSSIRWLLLGSALALLVGLGLLGLRFAAAKTR
jgi:hypothetical protein